MNMHCTYPAPFDARELRDVLGRFATGVAVITTYDGDPLVFFRGQITSLGTAV